MLEASGISHTYDDAHGTNVHAIDDVSLRYCKAALICILGPSGCGKTTLLKILAGLIKSSRGHVTFSGRSPETLHQSGSLAYLSQDSVLLPWLSVKENITLPLRYKVQTERPQFDIAQLLTLLRLQDFAEAETSQLSGGMRTRAALARAWITMPEVLYLDEPFGALDPETALRIGLELRATRRAANTVVLMITHSAEQAALLADFVVVLSARPARIIKQLANPLETTRILKDMCSQEYFRFLNEIRSLQGLS